MPIRWDTRNKRWRYEFDRVLEGRRHRLSRLLPKGWSQAQADAYERKESARLYAVASGIERRDPLVDEAVVLYLRDKTGLKSYKATAEHLAAIAWYSLRGKPLVRAMLTGDRSDVAGAPAAEDGLPVRMRALVLALLAVALTAVVATL